MSPSPKKKKETVIIYTTFAGISTISAVFFRKEKRKENEGKKVRFKYITASSGVKKWTKILKETLSHPSSPLFYKHAEDIESKNLYV